MAGESGIFNALGLGNEADYYKQDPFFMGGASILQHQLPAPRTNMEALLIPAIQGLAGGTLMSYGKQQALQSALTDTSNAYKQLTGNPYQVDNPDEWNFKQGQTALMNALMQKQAEQQAAEEQQKLQQTLMLEDAKSQINLRQQLALENAKSQNDMTTSLFKDKMTYDPVTKKITVLPGAMDAIAQMEGAKAKAENGNIQANPNLDPVAAKIMSDVPKALQKEAFDQYGAKNKLENAYKDIDTEMNKAYAATRSTLGNQPGEIFGIPIEKSKDKLLRDTAVANITSHIISVWKGPLDNNDAKRIVDPYIPKYSDDAATLAAKKEGLKQLIKNNSAPTPLLNGFNLADNLGTTSQDWSGSTGSMGGSTRQLVGKHKITGKPVYMVNGKLWVD